MPLAQRSTNALPPAAAAAGQPTCHVAVWFWAAQEAQATGLTAVKTAVTTLGNIGALNPNPQAATVNLQRSGNWNFANNPGLPPSGTVLLWTANPTHVAVVDPNNQISGYNQIGVFDGIGQNRGHTSVDPRLMKADWKQVVTIAANTIVTAAGNANL